MISPEQVGYRFQPIVSAMTEDAVACEIFADKYEFPGHFTRHDWNAWNQWIVGRLPEIAQERGTKIFFNLSCRDLQHEPTYKALLKNADRNRSCCVVEWTEQVGQAGQSTLKDAALRFRSLAEHGYSLAIDDVGGEGYSGLFRVMETAQVVEVAKIDGCILKSPMARRLIPKMADMLRAACEHVRLIAEWVETEEDLSILRESGIEMGQGFYWGRPMPATEYIAQQTVQ
ncbi:EAL domain-containing protein [Acidithiobacillus sp. MC6.1]|nr:EAL domain-containing protein [Acidithiobacillus sp. MC6.1]